MKEDVTMSIQKLKPCIAIIDDDVDFLKTMETIISKSFPLIKVDIFASADDAMIAIRNELYNIVVTDIELPGKKGDMLLHDLNAMESGVQTIVMTSEESLALIASCFRSGARAFINKSSVMPEIIAAVQSSIDTLSYWQNLMDLTTRKAVR